MTSDPSGLPSGAAATSDNSYQSQVSVPQQGEARGLL